MGMNSTVYGVLTDNYKHMFVCMCHRGTREKEIFSVDNYERIPLIISVINTLLPPKGRKSARDTIVSLLERIMEW